MTDKAKTPPAKKTIQDPPEYAAAGEATYQQNGQSDRGRVPNDWESGPTGSGKSAAQGEGARNPQTGERIARNPQRSQPPEVDQQEGGGPDVG
ncbi:hypothetical protein AB9E14_08320 [Rhizobium leguminosarum]|uniref:hypothetical protein n=1 Tax=Rhizobium leguminosarum TaxID=384 RepID=UPI001031D837|nr:hypothetical protein [Rhizobium leguminosarum]TAX48807.1 hypothetical protein ELH99_00455 [Rhizobium leguminosarum]TAZ59813.1 hypothetical protein ELH75_00455 [Rhizobium leguminosarum]WSH72407.1 hypothetical protein U8Q02_02375 [Rhizobium leguminosarum]